MRCGFHLLHFHSRGQFFFLLFLPLAALKWSNRFVEFLCLLMDAVRIMGSPCDTIS